MDSETLLDCLELAAAAREIDMQASPYDLGDYGYHADCHRGRGRPRRVRPCQKAIATAPTPLRAALWSAVTCCCRLPVTSRSGDWPVG